MNTNILSNSENSPNMSQISIFNFLKEENLSKEQFEQNMKMLISVALDEKQIAEQLNSCKEESIFTMIDSAVKFNDGILFVKFIINLSKTQKNLNLNKINIPELILIYFKKICLSIESCSEQKDVTLEILIKDYEDILMLTSDYFTKLIISESNLQNFEKFIERIAKEKIYTFYIVLSIILYNLCKTSTNINIKEYIELLKINQLPISSSGINSYIDFLCRENYLEICQSFFEDMISYKTLLEIPRIN